MEIMLFTTYLLRRKLHGITGIMPVRRLVIVRYKSEAICTVRANYFDCHEILLAIKESFEGASKPEE